jgi:hAT family C-terminal dimerisation region
MAVRESLSLSQAPTAVLNMGRKACPESAHFEKQEPTPKKTKHFVVCVYCKEAHNNDPENCRAPKRFKGRPETYKSHLSNCLYFPSNQAPIVASMNLQHPSHWSQVTTRTFERALMEFQHANKLPDAFIEARATSDLLQFLRPGIGPMLPKRRTLGGRILETNAAIYTAADVAALRTKQSESGGRINFLSDVWKNVSRDHLLGCQLSLFGLVTSFAVEPAGDKHDGINIAKLLEGVIKDAIIQGWNIGSVITDDAGQCGKARRILTLRWPKVAFLRCFAHDINNLVKLVLRTSFRDVASQAAVAVNVLVASSSKWLPRAMDCIEWRYKKRLALLQLCDTRWNSTQACFASLLRVKGGLKKFHDIYSDAAGFPNACKVFNERSFWLALAEAEKVIQPLSNASYLLQRDENTVADVVKCYKDIYLGFKGNWEYGRSLVKCIESRWQQCEQPLFMLGYALHPLHTAQSRELRETAISGVDRLADFAVYYYRRFVSQDDTKHLRGDFAQWITGRLFDTIKVEDFSNPIEQYWPYIRDHTRAGRESKLPHLAIVVLSIAVNTATCERLFSELGAIHTASRNKMNPQKALKIHVIRKHLRDREEEQHGSSTKLRYRIVEPRERPQHDELAHDVTEADSTRINLGLDTGNDALPHECGESNVTQDDDEDYISTNPEDLFCFWDSILDDIVDEELEQEMIGHTSLATSDDVLLPTTTPQIDPNETIADADTRPFPTNVTPNTAFPQEKHLMGLRATKSTLQMLFG